MPGVLWQLLVCVQRGEMPILINKKELSVPEWENAPTRSKRGAAKLNNSECICFKEPVSKSSNQAD